MQCLHCHQHFVEKQVENLLVLGHDSDDYWIAQSYPCPNCNLLNVYLSNVTQANILDSENKDWGKVKPSPNSTIHSIKDHKSFIPIRPKGTGRPPTPLEVDDPDIKEDYEEACIVLLDSPKASAALSRRCLQNILVKKQRVKESNNLFQQIEEAIKSNTLPQYISNDLHMVREIGNFAAHPRKSQETGLILPVYPHEAEWNLDVIEQLFEFYFVAPQRNASRRESVNKKLSRAGKRELPDHSTNSD